MALALAAVVPLAGCAAGSGQDPELLVFAAASLREVLSEIAPAYERESGVAVVFNFGGSGFLAQQIESSRRVDVFISADELWMDRLEAGGRLEPATRRTVASNRLVVVGHPQSSLRLARLGDLATAELRHLVVGDPETVPAGRYARAALGRVQVGESALWELLADRVVPTADVRAALALVQSTPGAVGVVYASDLVSGAPVRRLLEVPAELTPPIRYVAAALAGRPRPDAARAFLDTLHSAGGRAALARHGFLPPE